MDDEKQTHIRLERGEWTLQIEDDGTVRGVRHPNYRATFEVVPWTEPQPPAPPPTVIPPPVQPPDLTWLDGRAWRTEAGYQYPLGCSLFSLPLAMKTGNQGIYQDLATLRDGPFDVARIWHVKTYKWGASTRPQDSGHWDHIRQSYEALKSHGLRAMSTLFAGGSEKLTETQRRNYVVKAVEVANEHRDTVMMCELFNEHYSKDGISRKEIRDLGRLAESLADIPIALSAVRSPDDDETKGSVLRDLCGGFGEGFIITHHAPRDDTKEDGDSRMTRQGWHHQYVQDVPEAWIESEPGGPGSSVVSYTDPVIIGEHAANVPMMGGSAYVLHGSWWDGRSRIMDAPNMPRIIETLAYLKDVMPGGLPNSRASSHNRDDHPLLDMRQQRKDRRFVRAYARLGSKEDWVCLTGVRRSVRLQARTRALMVVHDIGTRNDVLYSGSADWTIPADSGTLAYLVHLFD